MVTADYLGFFSTMAGVGATLFGLIFVVVSIAPETFATANAATDRQIKALTSYGALLNPLIISMFALVPHQPIGIFVLVVSLACLVNTLLMVLILARATHQSGGKLRDSAFILIGLILYSYEIDFAVRLIQSPTDTAALSSLADMLVAIYVFGVLRAWELVGIRQFHIRDWLSSMGIIKAKQNGSGSKLVHKINEEKRE